MPSAQPEPDSKKQIDPIDALSLIFQRAFERAEREEQEQAQAQIAAMLSEPTA